MSEVRQTVRPLRRDECIPFYSTAHLLMALSSIPAASTVKTKKIKRKDMAGVFTENYELIKEMLGRFAPNAEIAAATGLTLRYIGRNIRSTEDLTSLADARHKVSKQNGGQMGRKKSRDRFAKHKDEILLALKTNAKHKVALQFGFSQKTLKVYVDEVKNGQ